MKYFLGVSVLVFLVAVEKATSLQCWKCSSDIDRACNDRFNGSDILSGRNRVYSNLQQNYNQRQYDPNFNQNYNPNGNQNYNQNFNPNYNLNRNTPILENCDDNDARLRRMKNVCVKEVLRGNNYVSIVRRCTMIPLEQSVGTCYDTPSRGLQMDFCEHCDYDGCNTATGLKTNAFLALLLTTALFALFRC